MLPPLAMHEAVEALQRVQFTASLVMPLESLLTVCRSMSAIYYQFIFGLPSDFRVPLRGLVCESGGGGGVVWQLG